jgi:hypothetical protein
LVRRRRTVLVEGHEHAARAKWALTAAARAPAEGRIFYIVVGQAEELTESAVKGGRRLRRQLEEE